MVILSYWNLRVFLDCLVVRTFHIDLLRQFIIYCSGMFGCRVYRNLPTIIIVSQILIKVILARFLIKVEWLMVLGLVTKILQNIMVNDILWSSTIHVKTAYIYQFCCLTNLNEGVNFLGMIGT